MQASPTRAGRRSLATIVLLFAGSLGACADATTAPTLDSPTRASATAQTPTEQFNTIVELFAGSRGFAEADGRVEIEVAVSCSATDTFDVVVEFEQVQKSGRTKTTVSGTETYPAVQCIAGGSSGWTAVVTPASGKFQPGNGVVRMRLENYQPWVIPATLQKRVRLYEALPI